MSKERKKEIQRKKDRQPITINVKRLIKAMRRRRKCDIQSITRKPSREEEEDTNTHEYQRYTDILKIIRVNKSKWRLKEIHGRIERIILDNRRICSNNRDGRYSDPRADVDVVAVDNVQC
jgi:hypothetical protein